MPFEGKGQPLRTDFLRATTTPSPWPRPPILGGEGGRFWELGMRERTRGDLDRTRAAKSPANEDEKTSPLAPLAGSRAGVRGGRELSGVEYRSVVLREKGTLSRTGFCVLLPPPHLSLSLRGFAPPILGGEETRFWELLMIERTKVDLDRTRASKSPANEDEKTSPSPRLRGAGPGVRGGRELSRVAYKDAVLPKSTPFTNKITCPLPSAPKNRSTKRKTHFTTIVIA